MNGAPRRSTGCRSLIALIMLSLFTTVFIAPTTAAIYRWDNGELITEKVAEPGADLSEMDLSYADLVAASLSHALLQSSDFNYAQLMNADLTDASFYEATLTAADLSGAVVRGAIFAGTTSRGFTKEQLCSTASYQSGDLTGIRLGGNDLTGWDFAGKALTDANFGAQLFTSSQATLTNADFTDAVVCGASFLGFFRVANSPTVVVTREQLYSTASYKSRDLTGINFGGNDLAGWDFTQQNLTNAYFGSRPLDILPAIFHITDLTDADLGNAIVRGANFSHATDYGFTAGQLYSTASYQSGDLTGVQLSSNDLSGWDLAGKNLTDANFSRSTLTEAEAAWDTSNLYTSGEATLLFAVPEPGTLALAALAIIATLARICRNSTRP